MYRSATTKCTAKSLDKQFEITERLFVALNTTMALAIPTERDFVGAGVGQSCECETPHGDQH